MRKSMLCSGIHTGRCAERYNLICIVFRNRSFPGIFILFSNRQSGSQISWWHPYENECWMHSGFGKRLSDRCDSRDVHPFGGNNRVGDYFTYSVSDDQGGSVACAESAGL